MGQAALSGPVRDTPPPPYRTIPFRDSIAEGGIAPICLVFKGYRASIAEIPLLGRGGVSHLHFACSPWGKCSDKGEGVSHPIGAVSRNTGPLRSGCRGGRTLRKGMFLPSGQLLSAFCDTKNPSKNPCP